MHFVYLRRSSIGVIYLSRDAICYVIVLDIMLEVFSGWNVMSIDFDQIKSADQIVCSMLFNTNKLEN